MNSLPLRTRSCPDRKGGFTLVEMLVAVGILAIILVVVASISVEITRAYTNTSGTIEGFRDARAAFEAMTRTISHATLNTYYDYVDSSGNFRDPTNPASFVPATYGRRSDLQFVSGKSLLTDPSLKTLIPNPVTHAIFFLSPFGETNDNGLNSTPNYTGLNNLLNACGFYLNYGPDNSTPTYLTATTVPKLYRYRLMQFVQPSENLSIYDSQTLNSTKWFIGPLATTSISSASQIAQNIVALIILPRYSQVDQSVTSTLAPAYEYDSRNNGNALTFNQLPPVVDITMVAIDEASALKLGNTTTPPSLSTGASFSDSSASQMQSDLQTLEGNLSAASGNKAGNHIPLHYRVFHAEVSLQSAKWTN